MNLSTVSDGDTARTLYECALQRAQNLYLLGATRVLELCAGPSLETLESAYETFGIKVTGNDIDKRWADYYPRGDWRLGDCLSISYMDFDAVVFAPPLSRGCSGRREDALAIDQVFPRYTDFMARRFGGVRCLVLPARSFATRQDRAQFFHLTFDLLNPDVVPLVAGHRRIRKYVDVYYKD